MIRPISFTPTSKTQKEDLVLYALVKGFKSASDYCRYAAVTMMAKNPLTEAQRQRVEELRARQETNA